MKLIRKISVGADFPHGCLHYHVGQEFGGKTIVDIIETNGTYDVFVEYNNSVVPWKTFNSSMAIAVEYDLIYDECTD